MTSRCNTYDCFHVALLAGAVLAAAVACPAATVDLKNGTTLKGEVVAQDDTKLVVKTAQGMMTTTWRNVSMSSLKTLNSNLYVQLKARADEEARLKSLEEQRLAETMLTQGFIKVEGKWLNKEQFVRRKLGRVTLGVTEKEIYKVVNRDHTGKKNEAGKRTVGGTTVEQRKYRGEITVKLAGLDSADICDFKIAAGHYLTGLGTTNIVLRLEKAQTLSGKSSHELVFVTGEYDLSKTESNGRDDEGKYYDNHSESGCKTDYYEVKIWLYGALVYEDIKGAPSVYTIVNKM